MMTAQEWRFEQIGVGVARWPTDVDQDRQLLLEEARKRKEQETDPLPQETP